jgi:hypothetical protein
VGAVDVGARRCLVALAFGVVVGGLCAGGAAAAGPPSKPVHASNGWSALPAAARHNVASALVRDGVGRQAPPARQSSEVTAHGGRTNDGFGAAVAVSGDIIVVGADAAANAGVGEAYVFRRPPSGWAHVQQIATLAASDGRSGDSFGSGVAISGATIVVSAPFHQVGSNAEQGALYVFVRPAAGWSGAQPQTAELTASDGAASDYLGYQGVAVSGNTVVAGAGYHQVGTNADQGAMYVFVRPRDGWPATSHEAAELTASDGAAGDYFGYGEVGISGNTVVGASGYHEVGSNPDQGAAYVFVRPPTGWSDMNETAELTASDGSADDFLGYKSVAVSGATVVAGAGNHQVGSNLDQGAGYVFVRPAAGWSGPQHEAAQLLARNGTAWAYFGSAGVAVSGATAVVDAPYLTVGGAVDRGATYLFSTPSDGWLGDQQSSVEKTAPDGTASDYLGYSSTAVSGTTVVVGSDAHQLGTHAAQGAVYVFALPRPTLSALTQLRQAWRTGSQLPSLDPVKPLTNGSRFAFSLNEASTVTVQFTKHRQGHSSLAGLLRMSAPQGHNRWYFGGRLSATKALMSGSYTATFSAANADGTSTLRTLHFTVLSR